MSECQHNTSIEVHFGKIANLTISRCTWGCGELLVSVLRDDCVTVTYAASELAALSAAAAERDELKRTVEAQAA